MARTTASLQPNHSPNPTIDCNFNVVNPKSLILSQFLESHKPNLLQLTTESFVMERGPRYKAYAELRESKLRMKNMKQQRQEHPLEHEPNFSPPKKQVKFQKNFLATSMRRKESSNLAQSVPDFSIALRKESRKSASMLPSLMEKSVTPLASSKNSKLYGIGSKLGGNKSANSLEKRGGGFIARKSYVTVEKLKGLSLAAANAINEKIEEARWKRGWQGCVVLQTILNLNMKVGSL